MQPISYTLSDRDIMIAQRASFTSGIRFGPLTLIFIVAGGAIGMAMARDGMWLTIIDTLPFLFLLIAITIGLGFLYLRLPRRAVHLFRQQKALADPIEVRWDDEAIMFRSTTGTSRLPWAIFSAWLDAREMLLIYQNDITFHPIPKRVLPANAATEIVGCLQQAGVPVRGIRLGLFRH